MPNLIKHAPDLLVAPFVKSNFEPGVGLAFTQFAHFSSGRALTFADHNTSPQSFDGFISRHAFYLGPVDFGNLILGRRDHVRKLAVRGQQQQAFRVEVQPADRVQAAQRFWN